MKPSTALSFESIQHSNLFSILLSYSYITVKQSLYIFHFNIVDSFIKTSLSIWQRSCATMNVIFHFSDAQENLFIL